MSSGSTFRNHCEQIASLLRAQISESTPTTIYNALQELQSNRDKLAAATGTGGSDLSLSDIIEQAVSDLNERSSLLNERNSLKAENQRLRDECITLRTLCRGLQETNGRLERGVNRLHRRAQIITDELQSWKIHAKETAKRAEQAQKEAEKQIAKAREDKALAEDAQFFYDDMEVAVSLLIHSRQANPYTIIIHRKGEFDRMWKDTRKHCDRYLGYNCMNGSTQMALHAIWEYLCRNAWGCDDIPVRYSNSRTRGGFFRKKSNPLESLFFNKSTDRGRPVSQALKRLVARAKKLQDELESYGFQAHIGPVGQLDESLPLPIDSGVFICVEHREDGCLGVL
ncbi:hypothetical protein ASPTUDRAFT_930865 [Aspergillus tubingensis CBS 134.48]|uniref:Uncharacterized protein n=1 Tax=Aspergillus tubingensis (strain CBS 134.48) TaxID=767770 RepID=A0A1L9MZV9_ASPTC|nr:hypothetical protein ASPTUDRAFT_930865 [Aspergillus tubingensis CBS 134.48]